MLVAHNRNGECTLKELCLLAALATLVLRYKLVRQITEGHNEQLNRMNKVAIVLGFFSCFGLSLVANFQVGFRGNIQGRRNSNSCH